MDSSSSAPSSRHESEASTPQLPPPDNDSPPDLTGWFLNAKHALASAQLCARAHVLVDDARAHLQEASVISARCIFLRNALQEQVAIAGQVSRVMQSAQDGARQEFEDTLTELDNADIRLNGTLELLRNSAVDPAFGSATGEGKDAAVRTLHDFVEDEGIENLRSKLRHSIDEVQESHDALTSTIRSFTDTLQGLSKDLSAIPLPNPGPLLDTIESHSDAMGQLLEGLTQHYDSCHLALRSADTNPIPSSTLKILARDALQVDGVVAELRERLVEIEDQFAAVQAHVSNLHTIHPRPQQLYASFQSFTTSHLLPAIGTLHEFEYTQQTLIKGMSERLDELNQLDTFYSQFISAYDAMVLEVGRRQGVKKRMQGIVEEAMRKLDALWEEDVGEREEFKKDHGDYLPVDLWPGLGDLPNRTEFKEMGGDHRLPDLGKDAIERAMARRRPERGGL